VQEQSNKTRESDKQQASILNSAGLKSGEKIQEKSTLL